MVICFSNLRRCSRLENADDERDGYYLGDHGTSRQHRERDRLSMTPFLPSLFVILSARLNRDLWLHQLHGAAFSHTYQNNDHCQRYRIATMLRTDCHADTRSQLSLARYMSCHYNTPFCNRQSCGVELRSVSPCVTRYMLALISELRLCRTLYPWM